MNAHFLAPDGQDIVNVSPGKIAELIQTKGTEYWEGGSGDAAIRFLEQSRGEMIFMVRKSLGVFIQFTDPDDGSQWVQCTDDDTSQIVSIDQAGEPWELPRAYFVERTLAEQIIEAFVKTAERPEIGKWVPF